MAALYAGNIPKKSPVPIENESARRICELVITGVIAVVTEVIRNTIPYESQIPMSQPKTVSITDSTRNCSMMSLLFAPIALRIPISLVRSDTVTRRIFITPIPQTMRDIVAIPPRKSFNVFVIVESVSSISA